MATLSTHVLDTALGRPAAGVAVTLTTPAGDRLGGGVTDADGRVGVVGPDLRPGIYVLTFATGDVILALGVVRREARAAGRRPSHHLAHLVVHGALHLQGHDHGLPGDARRMEMAETRLLHRMGVPDPWRTARRRP